MMCWRAERSISAIWCRWMKHKQRKTHPQAKRSLRGVPFDFVACTSWMSRRKSIQLSWMKSCSSTSSCSVRQKQKTSKRYAPMPLRPLLHGYSRHMGSTTMHSWHGKASRMLLHGSANRRSPHPFGSFSIVLKRKRILPLTITKIHLNGKRITRHEADLSASWRAFLGCCNLLILKYLCNPSHSHGKLLDRRFVPLVVPMQNAVEDTEKQQDLYL